LKRNRKIKVLVVDDEVDICRALEFLLIKEGYDVATANDGERALEMFTKKGFDIVITDLKMPGMSGMDLLKEIQAVSSSVPVIIMTAFASVESAVEAMKLGASDYIVKPFINDDVMMTVRRLLRQRDLEDENQTLRRQLSNRMASSEFIGGSPTIAAIFDEIEKVVPTKSNILILGESGTGKSLMAELIHKNSPRRDGPFLTLNCSAIPETLLESELFGYRKGAFTGANTDRKGLFEACDGGTLLLDEIGDMPLTTQAKLLKVIETGEVTPLGDVKPVYVDVRLIAATHRDLKALVGEGGFREDLYYRLDVIQFTMPSLRERKEDIPALAAHFLVRFSREHGKEVRGIDDDAMDALLGYSWSGNVRELMNVIERSVVLSSYQEITMADLPEKVAIPAPDEISGSSLKDLVSGFERKKIIDRLSMHGGDKESVARELGIDLATLYRKMKKLGIK
jgi:DNA-binding NtrC family response regulator